MSSKSFPALRLSGLVAATFTPFRADGALDLDRIPSVIDHVIKQGAAGLYVCGSTGEGPLLTTAEREAVAAATVKAARGRVPVVIQVGHNSLADARALAAHAQQIGADAISATPPGYFKPDSVDNFIDCLIDITAGAPQLPFYLYHIPVISGVKFDMLEFLRAAEQRLPSLRGVKFSDPNLHEMLACIEYGGGRYEILFGVDEMLLGGLAFGARGAVGSTYNFAAPLYLKVIAALDRGAPAAVACGGDDPHHPRQWRTRRPEGRDGAGRGRLRLQPAADPHLHARATRAHARAAAGNRFLRVDGGPLRCHP